MHREIQVISITAIVAMFSACTKTDTSSSQPSGHTEAKASVHLPKDETLPKKSEVKSVNSDKEEETKTRSAESHSHGDASLAIVLEGSTVTVELDTPLYNLLGFEHIAETAKQKAAVQKAEFVLSNRSSLFAFNSQAGCELSDKTIFVELGLDDHEDHEEDHDDDHVDDDLHDETHKDVTIQYDYKCSNPKALKNVTVNLFEYFENLTKLDLVYLGPNTSSLGFNGLWTKCSNSHKWRDSTKYLDSNKHYRR